MDDHSAGSLPFRKILHLTDFSACSDAALKWAVDVARANEAKLAVLHVVIPDALTYMTPNSADAALDPQEQWARREMQRIDAQLVGVALDTMVTRGTEVWPVVESKLKELRSDLIVIGTHGRTGLRKFLMGSVAEKILRSSTVPVMTIGPGVAREPKGDGTFRRVLLATNFTAGSAEAAAYASALAKRDQTELVLFHACEKTRQTRSNKRSELSIAEVMHRLYEAIPGADTLPCRPEALVEFGEAGTQILDVAKRKEADLIVMGIRNTANLFTAMHLEIDTAHNVVAQAPCPVLTVRPKVRQAA